MQTDDPFILERAILKLAFEREEVRGAVTPIIDPSWFFDDGMKRIAKAIVGFVGEYGDFPTKSDMRLLIGDDETATESFKNTMYTDVSDYTTEHLIGGIQDYIKRKLMAEANRALQDALSVGAEDEEIDKLSDVAESARGFKFVMDEGVNVFGDTDALWDEIHSEHNFIPTGLNALDKSMKGGLARGHTCVLFAESGFGKSAGLGSLGVGMALHGAKVLVVTMELSKGYLGTRLVQSALGLTNDDVWRMSKEQFREAINGGVAKECKDNLFVEEIAPGSNTYCIKKILKDYARKGIKFDCVITDYLQLMTPTRKLNTGSNSNEMMKWVCIELNAYAKQFDFAHLTAAQVNRTGFDRADYGMDAVAEGISIAQNSSAIWGMMATEDQQALGHCTLKSLKNRFGKKNLRPVVSLDFEVMQMRDVDPSVVSEMEAKASVAKGADVGNESKKTSFGRGVNKTNTRTAVKGIAV